MFDRLPIRQSLPMAAALMLAVAPALRAQSQTLFQWSGAVDREVQIAMRGNDVWTRSGTSENARDGSYVTSALPRTAGTVSVRVLEGRGVADVVQQPSAMNAYTAIVRIRDARGGADRYRIATYWQQDFGSVGGPAEPRIESRDRDECLPDPWGIVRPGQTCTRRDSGSRGGYDDWERGDNGGWDHRGDDGWERGDTGRGNGRGGYGRTRGSMHWSGAVDDNLEIRIHRRDIDYRTVRGKRPRDIRVDVSGASINRAVSTVEVRNVRGRGSVYVVQQPSARNDYTAILRVRDPRGGYGSYDFDVSWR